MSTKEPRIKISQDRTRICKYCIGDRVIVSFRKYGVKKFEAEVTEVCENMHGLEGVWISVLPLKALDPTKVTKFLKKCIVKRDTIEFHFYNGVIISKKVINRRIYHYATN